MKTLDELLNILLIDDNKEEYYHVKEIVDEIQNISIDLKWVDSYDKAVEEIENNKFDVFLIDYNLGGYTGLELLSKMEQISDKNNIKILLTGLSSDQIESQALQSGIDDYLSKDELNSNLLSRAIRYGIERKRALIEAEKNEAKYKQLYLNSKTPVMEVNPAFIVININQAFKNTFRFKQEFELDDSNSFKVWDLLDCIDYKQELMNHILHVRESAANAFRCRTQDGQVLELQMNVYELKNASEEVSYQIVIIDLTEQIKRDQKERQMQKLDLMEKMAKIVAHEVRNPLNNILLAEEQVCNEVPQEHRIYTDIIKRNANKIEELIRKFLNTFQPVVIDNSDVSLSDILGNCISEQKDKAKLLGVKVTANFPDGEILLILDQDKVLLVFNNLLSNAIKACETCGDPLIKVYVEQGDEFVYIKFEDNGKGISHDDLPKLFEPFFTNSGSGLGLGLTTSLNIIKSHHGDITASRNSDGGATFTVKLPVVKPIA